MEVDPVAVEAAEQGVAEVAVGLTEIEVRTLGARARVFWR